MTSRGVDGDYNIYACFNGADYVYSNRVHVLNPEGKLLQTIGISEGCPKRPIAIQFYRDGDAFVVTQEQSNSITLYELQRN